MGGVTEDHAFLPQSPEDVAQNEVDGTRTAFRVYDVGATAGALPTRGLIASLGVKPLVSAVNHGVIPWEQHARLTRSWQYAGQ
ncbi:hypothetical protein [Streptomyces sp. 11-1-2]|uniref:hypothetical protein n=2 Tax=unclassified Streptomyces TaxID=2593676 RepID=UPI0013C4F585|nr:hypothetical protein [Streptomyces sp. 11-1-2]